MPTSSASLLSGTSTVASMAHVAAVNPRSNATAVVAAPTSYFTDRRGGLFSVNVSTGRTTSLGNVGMALFDIAYSPSGQLYGIDSRSGLYQITGLGSSPRANFVATLRDPAGRAVFANALEFRADGRLFAAGYNGVYEVNPSTGACRVLFRLPYHDNSAGDIAFDPTGNLYVTTWGGYVVRRGVNGGISAMRTGRGDLYGLIWRDGGLYAFANNNGGIFRINYGRSIIRMSTLATGPGAFGATQLAGPVVGDPPPTTYFTDRRGGLFSVDVATGRTTSLGSVGVVLFDIAYSPSGQLFGIDGSSRLYRITGLGASPRAELVATLRDPAGRAVFANALEFRADGRLFAAGYNGVYEVNPSTGFASLQFNLPNRENSAGDIAFDPAGNLYVTTNGGSLVKRDAVTGVVTTMRTWLGDLFGLIWRDGGLYAFADGSGALYRITFGGSVVRTGTLATGPGAHGATQRF